MPTLAHRTHLGRNADAVAYALVLYSVGGSRSPDHPRCPLDEFRRLYGEIATDESVLDAFRRRFAEGAYPRLETEAWVHGRMPSEPEAVQRELEPTHRGTYASSVRSDEPGECPVEAS
ncbi:MAG: hypothetical protein AAGA48_28625 [Myxococcota bacterium]